MINKKHNNTQQQNKNLIYFSTPADERTSAPLHTPTECTPTTATATTSTCRRPCLPTPGSPSRELHGRYPSPQLPAPHTLTDASSGFSRTTVTRLSFSFLLAFINRELGIETVAPYPPSGHLHSHLHHYHPAPRLHHFPIPFMVSTPAYISINTGGRGGRRVERGGLLFKVWLQDQCCLQHWLFQAWFGETHE